MNCRDAQFLMRFRRPGESGAGDLAPDDAAALDQHLGGCPACASDARSVSAFDTAIGRAMRSVEVPASLKARLIAHTSAERGTVLRRRAYRSVALAASIFLAVGLAAGIFTANRPRPDTYELAEKADNLSHLLRFEAGVGFGQMNPDQADTNKAAVRKWLLAERLPDLPEEFDFSLLVSYHWEEVQGRQVPVVLFRGRDHNFAKVYAFRATQFNLKGMESSNTSNCQAIVYSTNSTPGVTFVVVFTGRSLAPFTIHGGLPAAGGQAG